MPHMGSYFLLMLVTVFQPMCTASTQEPSADLGHCSPAQEGSRHTLSKVFPLAHTDHVTVATIVRSPNARAHLELAKCTIYNCTFRQSEYRASIKPYDIPGHHEVTLTIANVRRKDDRRYLWYINETVKGECELKVFDYSSNVTCTPPRLLNRGNNRLYVSLSCRIDMVYPKPDCVISQVKDGKIIPKNYISSQTLNTDHYNHTCTMIMLASPDRLQEYEVGMFPEKLGAISTAIRFTRFNLSLPEVSSGNCPQKWIIQRRQRQSAGSECRLWRPQSSSGQELEDRLCGIGTFLSGHSKVYKKFIYPRKNPFCPTGFDPVGIYFDIQIEYPDSLSHVDIAGFGIASIHVGERQLRKKFPYYRIYTAFQPIPGQSIAFRLGMYNPYGFKKYVECYIPFYEHCPTLAPRTATPTTDTSTATTKRTTTTQRPTTITSTTTTTTTTTPTTTKRTTPSTTTPPSTVPKTTPKANKEDISTRTETTSTLIKWPKVSTTWNNAVKGNENSTSELKPYHVSSDAVVVDQNASSTTLLIAGGVVAVIGVLVVVIAIVSIVVRRRRRSKRCERPGRYCGVNGTPGAFENAFYDSSAMACSIGPDMTCGDTMCEAEYAEVGDLHCGKECLAVALPETEENPYETYETMCRP